MTSIVRTQMQQYVTAMTVDNKNIFVAGVEYVVVYNVEKLKMQILYDFYCRVGDMFAKIKEQCSEEQALQLDQLKNSLMSYSPCQSIRVDYNTGKIDCLEKDYVVDVLRTRVNRAATPPSQVTSNTRRSKAIARSQHTIENGKDPISMLRNSGFEDVKIAHPEVDLTDTANLIKFGNQLAE